MRDRERRTGFAVLPQAIEERATAQVEGSVSPRTPTDDLVELLDRSKHRFTPEARAAKWKALSALAERPIRDGALLLRFHEALCFLRAYPDDSELLEAVEDALTKFAARVKALRATGASEGIEALEETGVAETTIYCPLSCAALQWLADRFPELVEIDWDEPENEEPVRTILSLLVPPLDEESLVEVGVPYRAWLKAGKGGDQQSDLRWLLDGVGRAPIGADARESLSWGLQLRTRWELRESSASRTLTKLPVSSVFFHGGASPRWRGPLTRRLLGAPIPVKRASPGEGAELLDAARAAVTVRYRELYGFTFGDAGDIVVADIGRGARIVWIGVVPAHRLPLRAHYGYLLLKNGVPVGYGDASLLFDRAEVAFNIFEAFRHGESAFFFVRLLAFLHQHFGIRVFGLSRYQIGYANAEAIESGAFWFYDKLGFRPVREDLRRLAAEERRRIARDATYRSSRETLERFCEDGMVASIRRSADSGVGDFDVRRVGLRAAAHTVRLGTRRMTASVAGSLGARAWRMWAPSERRAFERLAPVLALIEDLPRWSLSARRALVDVIRAKGGRPEAEYLRRLRAHRRLRQRLLELGAPESA